MQDRGQLACERRFTMQQHHEPVCLILTRQALPTLDRTKYGAASGLTKGAYILADAADGKPDVLLIATGSEVSLCVDVYEKLKSEGIKARVVSMPSWELFENQSDEYRAAVMPPEVTARVCVEQAATFGWQRYSGTHGRLIGMNTFGASAPLKELQKKFGFTPEAVYQAAFSGDGTFDIAYQPYSLNFVPDADAVFREGLASLLKREPDLSVCGEADTAQQALGAIERKVVSLDHRHAVDGER